MLIDAPRSPAYELAEQVGATLVHEPRGFVVKTDGGRIADGIYAVGEMAGPLRRRRHHRGDAERGRRAACA